MVRTETRRSNTSPSTTANAPQPLAQVSPYVGLPALPGLPGLGLPGSVPQVHGFPGPLGLAPGFVNPFLLQGPVPPGYAPPALAPGFAPPGAGIAATFQDQGREVVATFEIPGVTAEDIEVVVGTQTITLRSERAAPNGRVYNGVFALPVEVLPSQASARLEDGLLVVTLPRRSPTEEPRRVEVEN